VNFHLNSVKQNETDIKNEWKNLQNILKSGTYETLGEIKGRNRTQYLHVWNDQIKQLIEARKK
jgi:hypothetical protein